jgi:hypothetical protein
MDILSCRKTCISTMERPAGAAASAGVSARRRSAVGRTLRLSISHGERDSTGSAINDCTCGIWC